MRIITPRHRTYIESYSLSFEYIGSDGSGCGFSCDKDGNVDESKLNLCALNTYKEALSGQVIRRVDQKYNVVYDADGFADYIPVPGSGREVTYKVSEGRIVDYSKYDNVPAVGECDHCGRHVHLHGFTNTCQCGADYNMSGQRLASRTQWGEETGESISDILAVR